jgi:hypothetical protein
VGPVNDRRPYEAPAVRVLGTLHSLTEQTIDKKLGPTDGYTFMGQGITNSSP